MRRLLYYLKFGLGFALNVPLSWLLGRILPKDPNLLVIGGRHFGGNTGAVMLRIHEIGIRAVWITRRQDIIDSGIEGVVSAFSPRAAWLGARAGAVLFSHALGDLRPVIFPSRKTRLYNIWHGMPVKRISTQDPGFYARTSHRSNLREIRRYSATFVTSERLAEVFALTFSLPIDRVRVTGQPRTDVIYDEPLPLEPLYDPPLPRHSRRILYAPTYRDGRPVRLFPFDEQPDTWGEPLQALLERLDAVMFVRTHRNDPGGLEERNGRVVPLQGDLVAEITEVLGRFDLLITDYSGIFYDFLFFDRPCIFMPYDIDEYAASPGFCIPYDELVVGPRVETSAELFAAIEAALEDPEEWGDRRREVRRLIHTHVDTKSTDRVLEFLAKDLRERPAFDRPPLPRRPRQ